MLDSLGHALGEGILLLFLFWVLIIFIAVSPWFLMLGLKAVKAPQRGFWRTILTAVFNWLVLVIPIAGFVIQWFIIKARHKTSLGKAILAWLIGVLVPLIIGIIVFFII